MQEGPPTNRLRRLGDAWERVLGYSREELTDAPKLSIVHDDDVRQTRALCALMLECGGQHSNRLRLRHKDGTYHLYEWNGIGVPERGLIFGFSRPVDERRPAHEQVAHDAGLELDPGLRVAQVGGVELPLTRSEFDLLLTLLRHRGSVVTADTIARDVWDYEEAGPRNFLQAHVSRLRRKLRGAGLSSLIERRRGVGYLIR